MVFLGFFSWGSFVWVGSSDGLSSLLETGWSWGADGELAAEVEVERVWGASPALIMEIFSCIAKNNKNELQQQIVKGIYIYIKLSYLVELVTAVTLF